MLMNTTDPFTMIPSFRYDMDIYCTQDPNDRTPGKAYARHSGFCRDEEIFNFDNDFFQIDYKEASLMCPGSRNLLEDGYNALHNAGLRKKDLVGRELGVFVGDTGSDWTTEITFGGGLGSGNMEYLWSGLHNVSTCTRLNYMYGMTGACSSADTACSSSLVAMGCAMQLLRPRSGATSEFASNRTKEALVAGVCVQIGPYSLIGMCALIMISSRGRCFTFDESGDGYARGEGNGVIYLKSSSDNNDVMDQLACLMSSQINQDGRSASMTAPNGPSQQACIKFSMLEAGLHPSQINIAECHGTGTALGDPIEVGALRNTMDPRDTTICLNTAKCFIGHLEGGAGMGGVMKCVCMLMNGLAPSNCHLREFNPNLTVAGFPAIFETEHLEIGLNSTLTGVSSFGFGGTNGRSDLWGQTRHGNLKCSNDLTVLETIQVTCPITMGPIDHLTGEPVPEFQREGTNVCASVLRDEFAPYDISTLAYEGGFRFRLWEDEVEESGKGEALPAGVSLFVCGSWSGYEMERMEKDEDGWYFVDIVLGETLCEVFDLCFNESRKDVIHPAVDRAQPNIWICGPSDTSAGQQWMIDGRDASITAGTVYRIRFKWSWNLKRITWTALEESSATFGLPAPTAAKHTYFVVGSWTNWMPEELNCTADGVWEGSLRIGSKGHREFRFVRDRDPRQSIYPSRTTGKVGASARGPDHLGTDRHWMVSGAPHETFLLKLQVVNAEVIVTVTSKATGVDMVWKSGSGWERYDYYVIGTFNKWKPQRMAMDGSSPGVFRLQGYIREPFFNKDDDYSESFRVLIDGSENAELYPESNAFESGGQIVLGPDADAKGRRWMIRSRECGRSFEIVVDPMVKDRRKTVTWSWVE